MPIDPTTWPAQIAALVTRARATLLTPPYGLVPRELVEECLREEGLPGLDQAAREGGVVRERAAEIEFLVCSALHELDRRNEALPTEVQGAPVLFGTLAAQLGWLPDNQFSPIFSGRYRATSHLLTQATEGWESAPTRWPNVSVLVDEAVSAFRGRLYVAGAVTARVAVEEAVRSALVDIGEGLQDGERAWQRETRLFASIPGRVRFAPLDRSATQAQLSGIRDRGNAAAHGGYVDNDLLQTALMLLLPQALASLAGAVEQLAPA